jgi:hypothetical protein
MIDRCDIATCAAEVDAVVDHPGRPEDKTALCELHRRMVEEELAGEGVA